MSGNLRIQNSTDLGNARVLSPDVVAALQESMEPVLARSNELVPKETGDLEESGSIQVRGGDFTVGIVYDSVYARYQHEHLWFHHPNGGTAKFLEKAMHEKAGDAIKDAARKVAGS